MHGNLESLSAKTVGKGKIMGGGEADSWFAW